MKVQPKTSRATAKGPRQADRTSGTIGSPEASSHIGAASNLNTPLPVAAQDGQTEAEDPNSSSKYNAANNLWICPEIPWLSEPKSKSRVAELVRRFGKIPYAATLRGSMAGSKWAAEVTEFVGPQLQVPLRESLENWLVDERNFAFLSAIHSCCFDGEMIPRREEPNRAEYIRGFILGVLRTWDSKKVAA